MFVFAPANPEHATDLKHRKKILLLKNQEQIEIVQLFNLED